MAELLLQSKMVIRDRDGVEHVFEREDPSGAVDPEDHEEIMIQEVRDRGLFWGSTFVSFESNVWAKN